MRMTKVHYSHQCLVCLIAVSTALDNHHRGTCRSWVTKATSTDMRYSYQEAIKSSMRRFVERTFHSHDASNGDRAGFSYLQRLLLMTYSDAAISGVARFTDVRPSQ